MSARTELAALLVETLGESFAVRDHYSVPDNIDSEYSGGKPVVVLWRGTITPGPTFGTRSHSFVVWLLAITTDPELVDDELDANVETLLNMLTDGPAAYHRVGWTEAERGTFADAYAGYRITLSFHTNKQGS